MWYPAGAHPHRRVRIFPADTLSFCLILFSHRSSIRKLHIVNMPFCSALFLKTAIKAAEIFEHLIILSRGLAPSGLSLCQSFSCVFLQAAEISVFSKVRVCAAQRSNESPSGAFKRQNGLAQQDGGTKSRQVRVCAAQRSNESPSGAFKRQNGLADGGATPRQVRVCAVERSNESPSGAFKRQNGLAQQDGGASPRQVHADMARFCGSLSTTTIHGRELRTQKFIRCSFLCIR